jgi:drug/metabolite transporter (DMT)-like permease
MNSRLSLQAKAYLALLVLAFIWGYNWVAMRIAVQYAGPLYFAALRLTLSGIGLFGLLLWLKKPLKPVEIRSTALSGAFQLAGFYGLSAWAMVSGGAGKTAVLAYGMPFWVISLASPVLGEKLRKLQWLCVALALAGLFCILMPLSMSEELFSKGLALLSGMSWAVGVVISKGLQKRAKVDLLSFTTWQTLFACIPIAPFVIFGPAESINWSFPLVAALFYSVVPGSIVAWLIWFYALSRLPAGSVGLCALATPIIGVLSAWLQMGERPSAIEGIGMMLVVIALAMNALQAFQGGE